MKKAIALFFCLQILSGNAFAMELLKMPVMIQHYFEHESTEHPDLSFSDFIAEHYSDDHHEDEATGHCDEKMPFKHCNDCCTHSTSISSFEVIEPVGSFPAQFSEYSFQLMSETDIPVSYLDCIWQPPKTA